MENITFTKPEVAEKFEAVTGTDVIVHKAGVYSGPFSAIPLKMAEAMVNQKSNLIKAKEATASKPEKDGGNKPPETKDK